MILDSNENQYSILERSSLWKNAGQTTVPYFDAQTVEGYPRIPLGGVGFHHRGSKDSPGFYGLTAHTIDYASFLGDNFSPDLADEIKNQFKRK